MKCQICFSLLCIAKHTMVKRLIYLYCMIEWLNTPIAIFPGFSEWNWGKKGIQRMMIFWVRLLWKLRNGWYHMMKDLFLEVGRDFMFIDEEFRVQVGGEDYKIDLLFFHWGLQCLVAFGICWWQSMTKWMKWISRKAKKDTTCENLMWRNNGNPWQLYLMEGLLSVGLRWIGSN